MNEINNDDIKSILYEISKNFILPKHRNLKDEDIINFQNILTNKINECIETAKISVR